MKKTLLIFFFLPFFVGFHPFGTSAQNPDIKRTYNWYFGNHAGLNFNSGNPIAVTNSAMNVWEGSAVMSDTAGNLLFYTDGDSVWNKNHQPMPNGYGLLGCGIDTTGGNYQNNSSSQGTLIVPRPGSDSLYYIFTTDCAENFGLNGLRYSTIDMALDGGLGDITNKNILLFAPSTEKLASIKHSNGIDYWVVSHDTLNNFFSYSITNTGVSSLPIISNVGSSISNPPTEFIGCIKFSPNGKKLASAKLWIDGSTELFDFDNATGIITNPIPLLIDTISYGVAFSPDNTKLYISNLSQMFQYDLCAQNIANSITLIPGTSTTGGYGGLQLGTDGKIYVAQGFFEDSLGVIINPNALGLACNYNANGLYLGGKTSEEGMPNFVKDFISNDPNNCLVNISELTINNNIIVYPNPFNTTTNIILPYITESQQTDINVYDILGNEMTTHFRMDKTINYNNIELKIWYDKLSAGVYAIVITTSEYIFSTKLIITN